MKKIFIFFSVFLIFTSFSFSYADPFILVPPPSRFSEVSRYGWDKSLGDPKHYFHFKNSTPSGDVYSTYVTFDPDGFVIDGNNNISTKNKQLCYSFHYDSDGNLAFSGGINGGYELKSTSQLLSSSRLVKSDGSVYDFPQSNSWLPDGGGGQNPPQIPQTTTLEESVVSSIGSLVQLGALLMGLFLLVLLLPILLRKLLGFSMRSKRSYRWNR